MSRLTTDWLCKEWDWSSNVELMDTWMQAMHKNINAPEEYDFARKIKVAKHFNCKPIIIYRKDTPLGYFMYHEYSNKDKVVHVLDLWLDEKYQRKGLGVKFMETGINYLRGLGFKTVQASALASNTNVLKMHKHFGFKPHRIYSNLEL